MNIVQSLIRQDGDKIINLSNIELALRIIIPLIIAVFINQIGVRFIQVPKRLENSRTKTYLSVTRSIISTLVYFIAAYYIFTALNINVTPLFASAGVIGIIIGLGLRSFIEDFFTGLFILTQDTISVGDYVEIGGSEGIVESLGLRTIRLKDQNGAIHIFPNSSIKKVINYSRRLARVTIDIPVKSNQSVDTAINALKRALQEIKKDKILAPLISEGSRVQGVEQISGGSVLIRTLIITRSAFRWDAARKFRYLAIKTLEKDNILLG